jgi:drug/metabolite transporter (DMT)-like permease
MEALPLHPQLVHLPLALAFLMPLVSLGLLLAWLRGYFPRRTWLIAVLLQVILVGSTFVATRTGEADEARGQERVGRDLVHEHEEAGEAMFFATIGVLVVIGAAQLLRNEKVARIVAGVAVLGAIAVAGAAWKTGQAGGRIVHGPPQSGAATAD